MPTKNDIIDNVDSFTAENLAEYIKNDLVSLDDLKKTGQLSREKRKGIESIISNSEEDDWKKALKENTIDAYSAYLVNYQDGNHRDEARKKISSLQETVIEPEPESEWDSVDKNDLQSLRNFKKNHPDDPHIKECRKLISKIQRSAHSDDGIDVLVSKITEIDTSSKNEYVSKWSARLKAVENSISRNYVSVQDILNAIKYDNNLLDHTTVLQLVDDGVIDIDDLKNIGIDGNFINSLGKVNNPIPNFTARELTAINKQCTEVYFWGIPTSGKTCALGGILSVAKSGHVARTMDMDMDCQEYAYMNWLSELFKKGEVTMLPGSTGFLMYSAMSFDLTDQDNKVHPITLVDLSGEVVRALYWIKADPNYSTLTSQSQYKNHINTITNILDNNRSENRKIHFFVIEYGAEKRLYDGLPQTTYLNSTLQYINQTGIFKSDTDGLYILLSKADKAEADGIHDMEGIRNYISNGYASFYNGLVKLSKDNYINDGHVEIVPFSLGKVCFRDFCLFDGTDSEEVVKILLERSYGEKTGKMGFFENIFRK